MKLLSNRATALPVSGVRQLASLGTVAQNKGVEILHLNIGAPDVEISKTYYEALLQEKPNVLSYAPSQGITPLIEEVIKYYKKMGANYEKEAVYITNGGSEGLVFTFMSICNPGDKILVFEPYYSNYQSMATLCSVEFKPVPTVVEDGFHLPSREVIESYLSQDVKAILFSNPCNPTGTVYSVEEINMLTQIAKKHNLWIIADEVYREFLYDNYQTTSVSTIKEVEAHTIIIDSISKRFSACGARIGFILTKNETLQAAFMKMCQSRLSISTLAQIGATALYRHAMGEVEESIQVYKKRRDLLCSELLKIKGVFLKVPEGAFYVIVKLPVDDAEDFCKWLLTSFDIDKQTVMLTPAKSFYKTEGKGLNEVRIAYVLNEEKLRQAVKIIELGLITYTKERGEHNG